MSYIPITEEQAQKDIASLLPWPAGKYSFEIKEAQDAGYTKVNAMGQSYPMTLLTLCFFNDNGNEKLLKIYLPMGGVMAFKYRHAAIACGLQTAYESGDLLPYMFKDKRGDANLIIEDKQPKKDNSGVVMPGQFWPAKNTVGDFITENVKQNEFVKSQSFSDTTIDDEIPF